MNTKTHNAPYTEIYVEPSFPDKLITILARPDLPDTVSARWIARLMQRPWRDVGKHVLASPKVLKVMAELGWTYKSEMGCKARSVFQRGEAALQRKANYAEEFRRAFRLHRAPRGHLSGEVN